jgi:hypothetical protein
MVRGKWTRGRHITPLASHNVFIYMPLDEHQLDTFWIITREQADAAHRAYHERNRGNRNKTGVALRGTIWLGSPMGFGAICRPEFQGESLPTLG